MAVSQDQTPALKGFNVLLQAEDDAGVFFITLGCAAADVGQAEQLALGQAQAEGWRDVEIDEVWTPDGPHALPETPGVLGATDREYVVEDDLDALDW